MVKFKINWGLAAGMVCLLFGLLYFQFFRTSIIKTPTATNKASPLISNNQASQKTIKAVFDAYVVALQNRDTKVYQSDLLTNSSKEIFAPRPAPTGSMAAEFASVNKPYSIKESGNYAVVVFDASETGSSPYFIQKTDKGWQIDLYTMMSAIRFDSSNNWRLVAGVDHPYLFAFESAGASGSDKLSCEQKGGRWTRFGVGAKERCDLPLSDGGKICSDGSQCDGSCIAELSKTEEQTAINGTPIKKTGRCTTWTSEIFGCKARVEKGMVNGILCAD